MHIQRCRLIIITCLNCIQCQTTKQNNVVPDNNKTTGYTILYQVDNHLIVKTSIHSLPTVHKHSLAQYIVHVKAKIHITETISLQNLITEKRLESCICLYNAIQPPVTASQSITHHTRVINCFLVSSLSSTVNGIVSCVTDTRIHNRITRTFVCFHISTITGL